VNTYKRTDNHETDWQILGEFELPDGIRTTDAVQTWLTEILIPLQVSTDFLKRFLESARASVARAAGTGVSASRVNVHISIFVPKMNSSTGTSWGFFQIERIEMKSDTVDAHIHAIDFYLYVEGD
jgi:hypothetical protein